jgi:N-acetylglucosaminyldiphosphoundecaprenol N-acetyl-beta-D-mannosaminyltransferase
MSMRRPTISLFGFRFRKATDIRAVADEIMQDLPQPGLRHLITPNASTIVYYNERRHRELKSFYSDCRYILPDGMPIVWLSRLKQTPRLYRLPGSDLFPELWHRIKAAGLPAVFVVANEALAKRLGAEWAGCRFLIPRMFSADDDAYITELAAEVGAAVRASNASFVFLGLNFPKQEKLGMRIASALADDAQRSVLVLLLGASFEFYFGLKPRAPRWMRRYGLEWLHRFMQEPLRLWKRYTVDNLRFIGLALKELFRSSEKE